MKSPVVKSDAAVPQDSGTLTDYRQLLTIVIVCFSVIYILATTILLKAQHDSLLFTQQEQRGLQDYQRVIRAYFDLQETQKPEKIAPILFQDAQPSFENAWEEAQQAFAHQDTVLTYPVAQVVLKNLILELADQSNLILDPELPSYYAVNLLFNQLTILTECKQDQGGIDEASHVLSVLQREKVPEVEALREEIIAIQNLCRHNQEAENSPAILARARNIAAIAVPILQNLLTTRLFTINRRLLEMATVIVVLYIAQIWLLLFAAKNYVNHREVQQAHEKNALLSKLADKNDELDKFAHAAAHDLKEPIRTMQSFSMLLKKEAGDLSRTASAYVDVIEAAARRSEQMINDLLGYTQVSEQELIPEWCDCEKEFAALLVDLKPLLDSVHPTLVVQNLPSLYTIPSMFRRVMLNVIDNAIKYRRQNVALEIVVVAEKQGTEWMFSVRDNGTGMTHQETRMAFEPFKRGVAAGSVEGSGIGLTSCKKIIERLGGRMGITSKPNEGTIVWFTLADMQSGLSS